MKKPKINTMTMIIKAYNKDKALAIARKANKEFCQCTMSYFLLEALTFDEWLVILAENEDEAMQAQEKFYTEKE